jgi:hypothetical protein
VDGFDRNFAVIRQSRDKLSRVHFVSPLIAGRQSLKTGFWNASAPVFAPVSRLIGSMRVRARSGRSRQAAFLEFLAAAAWAAIIPANVPVRAGDRLGRRLQRRAGNIPPFLRLTVEAVPP